MIKYIPFNIYVLGIHNKWGDKEKIYPLSHKILGKKYIPTNLKGEFK